MSRLWAVTSYFNPLGWASRLRNYRKFRQCLKIPLITVEWHPERSYALDPRDAEILIQVGGGDLMWQKEKLLQLGFSRLPPEAEYVAWVDCDILFAEPNLEKKVSEQLKHHIAVQLFSEVHYLGHGVTRDLLESPTCFAPRPASGATKLSSVKDCQQRGEESFRTNHPGAPGFAWAARRETLLETSLFDRAIMGSGDMFWLLAALGLAPEWLAARRETGLYNYLEKGSYPHWAGVLFNKVRAAVGHLEQPIYHLHHGDTADRRYIERHGDFNRMNIDYDKDIEESPDGVWRFRSPKPEWKALFEKYFANRKEDGR